MGDEDFAAFCAPIEEAERKIAMMPATTAEGIAAKVYLDMRRRHGGFSKDWMAVCPVYLEPEELSILSDVTTFLQGWVRA